MSCFFILAKLSIPKHINIYCIYYTCPVSPELLASGHMENYIKQSENRSCKHNYNIYTDKYSYIKYTHSTQAYKNVHINGK